MSFLLTRKKKSIPIAICEIWIAIMHGITVYGGSNCAKGSF